MNETAETIPVEAKSASDLIVRKNDLAALRDRIETGLDFSDPEKIDAVLSACYAARAFIREVIELAEAKAKAYIDEHGSFAVNGVRYFVGSSKSPDKVIDPKAATPKLLEAFAGDVEQLGQCLSANCYKPAQTKSFLESSGNAKLYDELFAKPKDKLMSGAEDELQVVDSKWVKKKPAKTADLKPD
jgi:hypothetical protein